VWVHHRGCCPRAVSQWLIIIVVGVEAVFIILERSGELHAATILSCSQWNRW
jgi:hypothetical protein